MDWNILLIISAIILLAAVVSGYKKGMVRAIISFVSLVITCVVVTLIGSGIKNYFDGKIMNVVAMALLLCLVGVIRHVLNLVFFSAKAVSDLPVLSTADKLLGIVVGVLETLLMLWVVYLLAETFTLGEIEDVLWDCTVRSPLLTWVYENNYLGWLVTQALTLIRIRNI